MADLSAAKAIAPNLGLNMPQAAQLPKDNGDGASAEQNRKIKLTTHFTQSQLALALALQKSKPDGISTQGMGTVCLPEIC